MTTEPARAFDPDLVSPLGRVMRRFSGYAIFAEAPSLPRRRSL